MSSHQRIRHLTIEGILSKFPHKQQKLIELFQSEGLHCVGCHAAHWETLEEGLTIHGKSEKEINELITRLDALLYDDSDASSITLTPRAAVKYLQILSEEGKEGWGLRFSEKSGDEIEYHLDYSESAHKDDEVFVSQGIEIHVEKSLVSHLVSTEIDYVDDVQGSGFAISTRCSPL